MTTHVKRIEKVESELNRLLKESAGKKDLEVLRGETAKLVESTHLDFLNLKAHVWGVGKFIIIRSIRSIKLI